MLGWLQFSELIKKFSADFNFPKKCLGDFNYPDNQKIFGWFQFSG